MDALGALETLTRHGVRFLVIGGVAGRLQGSPTVTDDIDICYARDEENLERLAAALRELGARLRGPHLPDDLPFVLDGTTLALGDTFTFSTTAGPLDILATPSGTRGFDDLNRDADEMPLGDFAVRVASIDALIRMKKAAGRKKDLIEVEVLGALRHEIDEADDPG